MTIEMRKYRSIVSDPIDNNISSDAVQNEDLGLVYAMRLNIEKNEVYVDNQQVKTGTRRIIEYLLTPLLRYQNESIRER